MERLLLVLLLGIVFTVNPVCCGKVAVCVDRRKTKMVSEKKALKFVKNGRGIRGRCEERFAMVCRNQRKTLFVNPKNVEEKIRNGDTLGRCVCDEDVKTCSDGTDLKRDWRKRCRFPRCTDASHEKKVNLKSAVEKCKPDRKACPDKFFVKRNPNDNCNFYPCPCTRDGKLCPDGITEVFRDGHNNCAFQTCPQPITMKNRQCCPPEDKPKCPSAQCCAETGQWSCPINRSLGYKCGASVITTGFGSECNVKKCCDASEKPSTCPSGEAACCPDGTWSCVTPGRLNTLRCGGEILHKHELSNACQRKGCCIPEARPLCKGKAGCCPDGQWTCDFIHNRFDCEAEGILEPKGLGPTCPRGREG